MSIQHGDRVKTRRRLRLGGKDYPAGSKGTAFNPGPVAARVELDDDENQPQKRYWIAVRDLVRI